MSKKTHHVVPHSEGWAVRRGGTSRASGVYQTQSQAIDAGRAISKRQGSELLIHGINGQIRDKDSHGHDPFPPKG